jgi:osmotically-inducible protein OsmY
MRETSFEAPGYNSKRSRPLIGFERLDGLSDISNYGRVKDYNVRMIPGPRHFDPKAPAPIHRGKGPKSYQRSDDRILEDICRRMFDSRYLDASNIEVKVEKCEVVLTGTVESRYQKRLAEDLCEPVYGVKNIENRLRIKES